MHENILKVPPVRRPMMKALHEAARQISCAETDVLCDECDIALDRAKEAMKELQNFITAAETYNAR